MSDFLFNVLNRHMGIGRCVRPRIHTRFERDDSVGSKKHYDSELVEPDPNSRSVPKQASRDMEPSKVSSADEPVLEITEQEHMERRLKVSHPEYVSKSISKLHDMSDNEVISDRYKVTDNSHRELVMQPEAVTEDVRLASKNNTGKRPNEKMQKTSKLSESADKYYHSPGISKADKPLNTVANINHKDSNNTQSKQHQQVTSELSSDNIENNIRPEKSLLESQLHPLSEQNINFEHQYMLQTSPRLTIRRGELHRYNVFLKDSSAETKPVTNISIGRIEVRAIPPNNGEKTKHKKKPTGIMSLDKYLNRQKQGGNR